MRLGRLVDSNLPRRSRAAAHEVNYSLTNIGANQLKARIVTCNSPKSNTIELEVDILDTGFEDNFFEIIKPRCC
ncbi:MAG: hypothetical protein QOE96_4382 [Blastocatellia bacterium]|jgi:hypothetical protein|nr:hypothetical protein [Blastocatellia bacterium]